MKILKVWSETHTDPVAELSWRDGICFGTAIEHLLPSVKTWIAYGIVEWIEQDQRITFSHEAEFLPRLAKYITQQSGLETTLEEQP